MTLVIGIDEAGYGPNLGPLCIGLSCWQVDPGVGASRDDFDLYELLDSVCSSQPDSHRLAIADSKVLYKPGGGLEHLERSVLAMLRLVDSRHARSYHELIEQLGADPSQGCAGLPWHDAEYLPTVPAEVNANDVDSAGDAIRAVESTKLCNLRARLVQPQEFNQACNEHGSKGLALSHWTLSLLREAIDSLPTTSSLQPPPPTYITCDKHGGRNNYAGLLTQHFPEYSLRVIAESRPRSAYLLTRDHSELQIEFRAKGESRLETALASMVAKYLRELSMVAFNQYWQSYVRDLKPTAGYPVDAKRFKSDIEVVQSDLGIDNDILWRNR